MSTVCGCIYRKLKGIVFGALCCSLAPPLHESEKDRDYAAFINLLPHSSGAQATNKIVVCVHNSRFPLMSPEIGLEVAVMGERTLMDLRLVNPGYFWAFKNCFIYFQGYSSTLGRDEG